MSVRTRVNLSSEPFRATRPIVVGTSAAAVLLLALLGFLISLSVMERGQAADARKSISSLEKQIAKLNGEQAKFDGVLRKPENAEVLERSLFLNSVLYAKGISWTRLFDDLEKVMPHNVRLVSIRPQIVGQNAISLDMVVGAESASPVVDLLTRLERSPRFGATELHNRFPPTQTEPLLRYRISVNYSQEL